MLFHRGLETSFCAAYRRLGEARIVGPERLRISCRGPCTVPDITSLLSGSTLEQGGLCSTFARSTMCSALISNNNKCKAFEPHCVSMTTSISATRNKPTGRVL